MDNSRAHHSKLAKAWLAERAQSNRTVSPAQLQATTDPEELFDADLKQAIDKRMPVRTKSQVAQRS